jgi:ABC-type multidrug transport system fused ATPase/permease subunit
MPRNKRTRAEVLGILGRASAYLRPYIKELACTFVLIAIVSLCSIAYPPLVGWIIDDATKPGMWSHIELLLAVYAGILVIRTVSLLLRNHLMQTTGMKVTCDVRIAIFSHLQKLSLKFYEDRQTGRIVARITEDGTSIYSLVTGASVTLIGDIVTAAGVLIYLFTVNWKLAIISLFLIPLFLVNYRWHRRRMRMESRRHMRNWMRVVGFLNERIANNRVVRAFATVDEEADTFRDGIGTASSGATPFSSPSPIFFPASASFSRLASARGCCSITITSLPATFSRSSACWVCSTRPSCACLKPTSPSSAASRPWKRSSPSSTPRPTSLTTTHCPSSRA